MTIEKAGCVSAFRPLFGCKPYVYLQGSPYAHLQVFFPCPTFIYNTFSRSIYSFLAMTHTLVHPVTHMVFQPGISFTHTLVHITLKNTWRSSLLHVSSELYVSCYWSDLVMPLLVIELIVTVRVLMPLTFISSGVTQYGRIVKFPAAKYSEPVASQ